MNKTIMLGIDGWYPQVDGGTNVVKNYRKNLKKVCDCEIIAPSYGKKYDEEGERVYCAGVFHNFSLGVPFISFRNSMPGHDKKLKKFLEQRQPVLLHAHSPFAICGYFLKYAKKRGIPVVYTFHTRFKDEFMRVTHSRLITAVMMSIIMRNIRRADYVWAVSASSATVLRQYGYKGDIKVMPNGTDMPVISVEDGAALARDFEKEWGISPNERIFMYSGRVVTVKNIAFSFEVVAELKRRGFACKFIVAGGGDDLEYHKKLAAKLGLQNEVIFTGFMSDRNMLRACYCRADLLLFPSLFDTFGLVVQEAAACRTPSFVPENSCSAEMIEDGKTGYISPLNVSVWADRIEEIFSPQNAAARLAVRENSSSMVLSWESAVSFAEEEYEKILGYKLEK